MTRVWTVGVEVWRAVSSDTASEGLELQVIADTPEDAAREGIRQVLDLGYHIGIVRYLRRDRALEDATAKLVSKWFDKARHDAAKRRPS